MDIQEFKDYFASLELPTTPIYLDASAKIIDVPHFLESHFKALEINPDSKINVPIKERLIKLRGILSNNMLKD